MTSLDGYAICRLECSFYSSELKNINIYSKLIKEIFPRTN
jgi:hypothetical protein